MAKLLADLFEEAIRMQVEGIEERDGDKILQALEMFNNLLNQAPHEDALLFHIATLFHQRGWNGLAIRLFKELLKKHEGAPEMWCNLGTAYKAEHMDKEAEEAWRRALALRESAEYYANLSTLYINKGGQERGLEYASKAVDMNPSPKNQWNYALALIENGQWEEGLVRYEYGLQTGDRPMKDYGEGVKYWEGQELTKDDVIVVYGEQGLGDEIMFASALLDMIAYAADRFGATVIYDCHERLETTMKRSFPMITIKGSRKQTEIPGWASEHKITWKVGIGSLFKHFHPKGDFHRLPYLTVDSEKVSQYRELLGSFGEGPYLGVGWTGGHKRTHGHERSLKLSQLNPIMEKAGTVISLQYTDGAEEKVDRHRQNTGINIHHFPDVVEAWESEGVKYHGFDYDETLHLLAALDAVVAINTTAVHACGALGVKCITLTPDNCAWRYTGCGEHMCMYGDHVTVVRENGDWSGAIGRAKALVLP